MAALIITGIGYQGLRGIALQFGGYIVYRGHSHSANLRPRFRGHGSSHNNLYSRVRNGRSESSKGHSGTNRERLSHFLLLMHY